MALERLTEQLKDQWADLSGKIQENSTFNNVREKFEAQSPAVQKAILAGLAILVFLFLISFPWGYISDAQDHMAEFEDNRQLIQGLLHASRAAKEPSPLPPPISPDMLRARIEGVLKDNRLIPEQIGEMQPMPDKPAKDFAPPVVVQTGLAVQLKNLNLDQIMVLSHELQSMSPGIKLMGVDIVQAAGQSHYYNMNARVVAFGLPAMVIEDSSGDNNGKKGGKSGKKKAPKNDEETVE